MTVDTRRWSAQSTGSLPYSWYSFLLEAESTHNQSATGRIMSMKNYNNIIGNRTRDLPFRIAVPQPTEPPRAPGRLVLLTGIPRRSVSPRAWSQSAESQQTANQPVSNQTANKPSTKRSAFVLSASWQWIAESVSHYANKQFCLQPDIRPVFLLILTPTPTPLFLRTAVGYRDVSAQFEAR